MRLNILCSNSIYLAKREIYVRKLIRNKKKTYMFGAFDPFESKLIYFGIND